MKINHENLIMSKVDFKKATQLIIKIQGFLASKF